MYKLPDSLEEYFTILESKYGKGDLNLPLEKPWFFSPLLYMFARLHPDKAVKRYEKARWEDLRRLYSVQIALSSKVSHEPDQISHFESVCGSDEKSRNFGQLPCTIASIKKRVSVIEELSAKDKPILVVGDDDALCVALKKAGFKDITVLEIDPKVVSKLNHVLNNEGPEKVRIEVQDILEPIKPDLHRPYEVVSFDPWYTTDGFEAFMNCAMSISRESSPKILLSFNAGALLNTYEELKQVAKVKWGYSIHEWFPLANTYPMPLELRLTLTTAEKIAAALSFHSILKRRNQRMFFSSDLMVLKKDL